MRINVRFVSFNMHIIVCEASDEMDVQVALEMKVSANRKERDVMSCHIQQVGILFQISRTWAHWPR